MASGGTNEPTIILAGGGSGGHIQPGIAIAERVLELRPDAIIHFIAKDQELDRAILDAGGWEHTTIDAAPFALRPRALLWLMRRWGGCVRTARRVIRDHQGGGLRVVALGGYVSAPVAQAARVEGAPVTLVNLDGAPGLANRWIARHAAACFTAARLPRGFGWTPIAPVVRRGAVGDTDRAACKSRLGIDPTRPMLLVTGASQGARSINRLLMAMAAERSEVFQGWTVLHQKGPPAGDGKDPDVERAYTEAGIDAKVVETIDAMGDAWGACDLAVCRCGAGTVGEVWANATPALMLPYPHHRDQHQRLNAAPLAEVGGVVIVDDLIDPERNLRVAGEGLAALMHDAERREAMCAALECLGPADGAAVVAAALVDSSTIGTSEPS